MDDRVRRDRPDRAQRGGAVGQVERGVRRRDDLGAAAREHVREVRPDEPRGAREQDPHRGAASSSATATGRPSRSERQAARPITSGARASAAATGVGVPSSTAARNASQART